MHTAIHLQESMQNILMHLEKRHGAQGSVQLWEAFNEFIKLVEGKISFYRVRAD